MKKINRLLAVASLSLVVSGVAFARITPGAPVCPSLQNNSHLSGLTKNANGSWVVDYAYTGPPCYPFVGGTIVLDKDAFKNDPIQAQNYAQQVLKETKNSGAATPDQNGDFQCTSELGNYTFPPTPGMLSIVLKARD